MGNCSTEMNKQESECCLGFQHCKNKSFTRNDKNCKICEDDAFQAIEDENLRISKET